ncbi:hypothetical protein EVA_21010, partial [gut metagenome]
KGIIDEVGKVSIADVKFEGNNDLIQMWGLTWTHPIWSRSSLFASTRR